MSGRWGRIKCALTLGAFAAFLWASVEKGGFVASGKALENGALSRTDAGDAGSAAEAGEIADLSEAFSVILKQADRDTLAGYALDESFLLWFLAQYGSEAVNGVAFSVLDGEDDENVWYEQTGNSIHVLWLSYCRDSGFGRYWLDNVYWREAGDEEQIVFGFAGDINFAEDWYTTEYMDEQAGGISDCFSDDLLAEMQGVDVLVMNNEFTYADGGSVTALAGKAYTFRADTERVGLLETFGTDVVTLANNHVYDYGEKGLLSTLETLKNAGILYSGAGENIEEASGILYFVINGRKIAYVSATQIERSAKYTKEATETEAGVLKALDAERFLELVREADAVSDYVIAELHWGTEGSLYPDGLQRKLARQTAQAGADAVIGGHPHRLQGAAFVGDVPVAYSLGNFWFSTGTLYTALAEVTITRDGELTLSYVPCVQKDLKTELITDSEEKEEFYRYLAAISTDVGIDSEGNVYDISAGSGSAREIVYSSENCATDATGMKDNEGRAIDIVGNLRED